MRIARISALVLVACGTTTTQPAPNGDSAGCGGASLLANPTDLAAHGPWAVGARTVSVGNLRVEVWYPAARGSDAGKEPTRYDIRQELPPEEAAKIPDAENPWQTCDCVRDLSLDQEHGPYPAIVFVHGTAAFATSHSLS